MKNRFRNRSEFVITPEMRARHREFCRDNLVSKIKSGHAFEFPYTYLKDVLGAAGLPLEAVRWINGNDYKPKAWWKRQRETAKARWDQFKIDRYTIRMGAYSVGTEEEFREFVSGFKEVKSEYGSTWKRKWRGQKYWFTTPGDKIVNKEIVEPKTNGDYLSGAVGWRFDDDFFVFAIMPYRYRNISNETAMTVLFPNVPLEEYRFIPDSGSPELELFMQEQWMSSEAIRIVMDRQPRGFWQTKFDDAKVSVNGDDFSVTLTKDDMSVLTEVITRAQISEHIRSRHD